MKTNKKTWICSAILATFMLGSTMEMKSQDADLVQIEVSVTKLRNDQGVVGISLLTEDEDLVESINIAADSDSLLIVSFKDLKKGRYAIKMFHDENENKILDKNQYGMPKEGYGFSNNPDSRFGPPTIKKLLFDAEADTKVDVSMNYYW